MPSLIFTAELIAKANEGTRTFTAPLLHRWATRPDDGGAPFRAQLSAAASLVPAEQRSRVLGMFSEDSRATDDQVESAAHQLLLAKTLSDHGWSVDMEPPVDGLTPDFKLEKNGASHLVEVTRISREAGPTESHTLARIQEALAGIETKAPVDIRVAIVDGKASLKPFVTWLRQLWSAGVVDGQHTFSGDGVYIVLDLLGPCAEDFPAVFGWFGGVHTGRGQERVKNALQLKLRRYKTPLLVALDVTGCFLGVEAIQDVLFGKEQWTLPFDPQRGADPTQATTTRDASTSILSGGGRDAQRAQQRLLGVLAFEVRGSFEGPCAVHARLIANPAIEPSLKFPEFVPIPRLIEVSRSTVERHCAYVDAQGRTLEPAAVRDWQHVP